MVCQYCFSAELEVPISGHPAYLVCPACQSIELTYEPQDYQEAVHTIPYTVTRNEKLQKDVIDVQVIGVFGG